MLSKLREILLTQYIGSILIGLLVWQAAIELVTRIGRLGFWFSTYLRTESAVGGSSAAPFRWDGLVLSVISAALYLLVAYGLARWLYVPATPAAPAETENQTGNQSAPDPEAQS
jgi:hypothetical protein